MVRWQRWQRRIALLSLVLWLAIAAGPARAGDQVETLVVPPGESRIIAVTNLERVAVADPAVADVVVASRDEVIVNGKKPGRTSLHLWEGGHRRSFLVQVQEPQAAPAPAPAKPEAEQKSKEESARRAAEQEKEAARQTLAERVERAIGLPSVRATLAGEVLLVDGTVPDQAAAERAKIIAEALGTGLAGKVAVTLRVKPVDPPQVLLQVQVLEIATDSLNQLGITWGGYTSTSDGNSRYFDAGVSWVGELAINGSWGRLSEIIGHVDAMLKEGSAKLLAAPSILTRSGKQAEFLAGGEFPVVVLNKDQYTIYWKDYGVKLAMLPEVQEDGVILVHLKPEVSTLDWANGAKLSSGIFPALKTRRAEADVRLRDGATLVIGGLLRNEDAINSTGLPLLSKLPIIGQLFASKGFQQGKTQLVFFVTPRLVRDDESPTAGEVAAPAEMELQPGQGGHVQ